jgi:hypothetical protein
MCRNINTMKKNVEVLLDNNNEIDLEVNKKKNKVYVNNSSPDCRTKHDVKVANKCIRNIAKFRYLGMTVTNQNCIHEEIKCRLNLGNACYHLVHNLLSCLVPKDIKINTYKTVIILNKKLPGHYSSS